MKEIIGTSNRFLEVNLTTREVREFRATDEDRQLYIGGKGLGLKYIYDRMDLSVDPLGKGNILAFMMGVMISTGAPCTGRFAAITKSPLTGIMASSSCGGPFGIAYKTAGYDGLLISGKAEKPVYLVIDENGVQFEDASDLWGKETGETQENLKLNKTDGALVIGPAGENHVLYANIRSGHRFLGRGGMGAVMGAKNLKAIVAKGKAYKIVPKNPDKFKRVRQRSLKYINNNPLTSDSYRNFGTSYNVNLSNDGCILPVYNFRDGSDKRAKAVSGETMQQKYHTKPSPCKPCAILCGHKGEYPDGTFHQIPEYETVGLLGPNLGNFDPDMITTWNDICGELGMDTISAGATIAYVIEAGEKGLMRTNLTFDSPAGISEMLYDIGHRRDQGDELANGSRWLSQKYGGEDFAIHVKGLELPAYDPRGSWGHGLNYAVANRGGCHLSSFPVALEVFFGLMNPHSTYNKEKWVCFLESLYSGINSLHCCQFTAYAYILEPPIPKLLPTLMLRFSMTFFPRLSQMLMDWSVYSGFFESITGLKMSKFDFLEAGDRIHVLERYMNTKMGISRKDDTLPGRFLKEGRTNDPKKRVVPLEKMVTNYYKVRGYDQNGIPTIKILRKLRIPVRSGKLKKVKNKKGYREIKPGRKYVKKVYLWIMLWFVGRAIQAAAKVDRDVRKEFARFPEDFTVSLGILPDGPCMIVGKDSNGNVKYMGRNPEGKKIDLRLHIKHLEAAFLLFTFQESTCLSISRDRIIVAGDLGAACAFVRILNIVEAYLLPKFLARLVVKRYQSPPSKHINRIRIYFRTLLGY